MWNYYFAAGSGDFPTDMLRHDHATVYAKVKEVGGLSGYIITSERAPTQDRWQSFNWGVAMLRSRLPAGNSEQGPVLWEIKRGERDWEPFHYVKVEG